MNDQLTMQELLKQAKEIAYTAGNFLKNAGADSRKVERSFDHDVKITADKQSEKMIVDYLQKNTDISILSEESGRFEANRKDMTWIVDPVDGSLNYSQSIPMCCLSIGLWQGEKPLLGVIYDFNRDEMFSGIVGQKAFLNDQPIHVSNISDKKKGLMCSGFPNNTDYSTDGVKKFISNVQDYRKVRCLGTAALSIAYVACGRADAYFENDIMLWDIAGGVPIVLAAGGAADFHPSAQENAFTVFISNGII